jgi:hypothetical protein
MKKWKERKMSEQQRKVMVIKGKRWIKNEEMKFLGIKTEKISKVSKMRWVEGKYRVLSEFALVTTVHKMSHHEMQLKSL